MRGLPSSDETRFRRSPFIQRWWIDDIIITSGEKLLGVKSAKCAPKKIENMHTKLIKNTFSNSWSMRKKKS